MDSSLEVPDTKNGSLYVFGKEELRLMVNSHLNRTDSSVDHGKKKDAVTVSSSSSIESSTCESSPIARKASSPLQSVLEESEGGEESEPAVKNRNVKKGEDKPSKRSRVQ